MAETGSTNADLLDAAVRGTAAEGDWLIAARQTRGRGRQGREWSSPPGNLYASGLVALRSGDPPAPTLALVAGVALHDALALSDALLKWPNDVLVDSAKLAGILLERVGQAVVIGIGVNVAHCPELPDRRTTSLAMLRDHRGASDLVAPLSESLKRWVQTWRSGGIPAIRDAWLARAHAAGTPLAVRSSDAAPIEGRFDGLTDECALRLRLADGGAHVIHAGDVFLV